MTKWICKECGNCQNCMVIVNDNDGDAIPACCVMFGEKCEWQEVEESKENN